MSTKIRIGGVPEHFNIIWHYAIEKNYFSDAGIEIIWTDYPSGSSPMAIDMDGDLLDIAVGLTESFVTSILNGGRFKIVSWYVTSPLIWGIHVASDSSIHNTDDMKGKKYAVSRLGSGSHLMALVDAKNRGLKINSEQFVVTNNLAGAVKSLVLGKADIFFWEKFTTKPYVDDGTFRRIDVCPTPWPSFVVAVGDKFLAKDRESVTKILDVIHRAAKEFRTLADGAKIISERYGLKLPDVEEWYASLSWAQTSELDKNDFESIVNKLLELGVVSSSQNINKILG